MASVLTIFGRVSRRSHPRRIQAIRIASEPIDVANDKSDEMSNTKWPIGVFTSLNAGLGVKLDVVKELQIPTLQLHAPQAKDRNAGYAQQVKTKLDEFGLALTAVFGGFAGESYESIPIVEQTVGLVPPETRAQRLQEMKDISDFSRELGCGVIALHLGFVTHNTASNAYSEIVGTTRELCHYAADNGQALHLETGQETADALVVFIQDTGCDNLFVNFDPANMILYGTGEPIDALRKLRGLVRSVHCKDAKWAAKPGDMWGTEVPLGEGDVDISSYLKTLDEIGYEGPLTIEREIPEEPQRQKQEIGHAVHLLNALKRQHLDES